MELGTLRPRDLIAESKSICEGHLTGFLFLMQTAPQSGTDQQACVRCLALLPWAQRPAISANQERLGTTSAGRTNDSQLQQNETFAQANPWPWPAQDHPRGRARLRWSYRDLGH